MILVRKNINAAGKMIFGNSLAKERDLLYSL